MKRLIYAEDLDKTIKKYLGTRAEYEIFATMIDMQPTAFDVQQLIRDIEANADGYTEGNQDFILIETVKSIIEGEYNEKTN